MTNALKNSSQQKENTNSEEGTSKGQEATLPEVIKELGNNTAENDSDLTLEKIIEHFPKRMQTRARLIGGYIQNGEKPLTWNKKGELLADNKPISGSSIQDLLYDTTCIKRKYMPTGANIFYKQLHQNNIPAGLILNSNRRKLMKLKPTKLRQKRKYTNVKTNWLRY